MTTQSHKNRPHDASQKAPEPPFFSAVKNRMRQKRIAKQNSETTVWMGLGMMGLVGWSIAIPTILGAALGIYLDRHFQIAHSWTLAFICIGLLLGCVNAWYWIKKENLAIEQSNKDPND